MKIALGVDHGAFVYKEAIASLVRSLGHEIVDCGTDSEAAVDYPVIALAVARAVRQGQAELGIFACGTGIGGSIAANKVKGIRAALCHESFTAAMAREHNHANILCLGARVVGLSLALEIVRTFLATPCSGDARHVRRVQMLEDIERSPV